MDGQIVARWFTFDEDEKRDAERVAQLESLASYRVQDVAAKARLLAEADELRAKWNQPRGPRFQSIAEVVEELQAVARAALDVDVTDAEALDQLGQRASAAGGCLESFATDLHELDAKGDD